MQHRSEERAAVLCLGVFALDSSSGGAGAEIANGQVFCRSENVDSQPPGTAVSCCFTGAGVLGTGR